MKFLKKKPFIISAVAIALILGSSAYAARAAFVYQTQAQRVDFSTAKISLELMEEQSDGSYKEVSENGLTFPSITADSAFKIGKHYDEHVKLVNNSSADTGYDEYVRVRVSKSWYKDGAKDTTLDPSLIELDLAEGWTKDEEASTAEQDIYYMTTPLKSGNEAEFLKGITINDTIVDMVSTRQATDENGTAISGTIENIYKYDGQSMYVELTADAVQTHNAEAAIKGAWGLDVNIDSNGTITGLHKDATDLTASNEAEASWNVSYTGSGLNSDYDAKAEKASIEGTMPGDTILYTVNYTNSSSKVSDWYLSSDIVSSLEDTNVDNTKASGVSGGAYSYSISYKAGGEEQYVFDSETLGGDDTAVAGLNQAEASLADDQEAAFYIGRLSAGQTGTVTVSVKLDGNSQDNSYMSKLAAMDLKLAVEDVKVNTNVVTKGSPDKHVLTVLPGGTNVVVIETPSVSLSGHPKTGDSILPLVLCGVALIIGILLIIWYFLLTKRNEKEEA